MKKRTCVYLMLLLLFSSAQAAMKPELLMERLAGTVWFCVQGGTHAHFYRFHDNGTCTISWHDWDQWDENQFWKSYEEPFIGVSDHVEIEPYLPEDKSTRQMVKWSIRNNDAAQDTFWDNPMYILELTYLDGSIERQGMNIGRSTMTLTTMGSGGAYRLMENGKAVTDKGIEGVMDELLSLFDESEYDGYEVIRTDMQTGSGNPGDIAAFILEVDKDDGYVHELVIAKRIKDEYRIVERSLDVLSGEHTYPDSISISGNKVTLAFYDGVSLVFEVGEKEE